MSKNGTPWKGGEFSSQMKLLNTGFSSTLPTISIQCTTDVLYAFFPLFSHELLEIHVLKNKDLIKSIMNEVTKSFIKELSSIVLNNIEKSDIEGKNLDVLIAEILDHSNKIDNNP